MARLIDADAVCEKLTALYKNARRKSQRAYSVAIDVINGSDTIEVEPVKPALPDDERKASEAWCENCDHIEMCKWYPTCGCEFRQIGGKPAGRAEPPERKKEEHE